ncbi:Hypothetical predicted protein [Marmota monax]|uniref:Uncharacterized protein n=1 Tax=Marmota monax TaxID=9995 RepID=A0A5E4D5I5_MARMO|nr:Hypothetical predicted protein [Marmota monax]
MRTEGGASENNLWPPGLDWHAAPTCSASPSRRVTPSGSAAQPRRLEKCAPPGSHSTLLSPPPASLCQPGAGTGRHQLASEIGAAKDQRSLPSSDGRQGWAARSGFAPWGHQFGGSELPEGSDGRRCQLDRESQHFGLAPSHWRCRN